MRAEGICAFVSYRGQENGRYIYSIGNLSPYGGFDLPLLYQKLNQVEGVQGNDVWGGSDNCGGSPRERGSSLCPQDLAKLIENFQRNLANARFSDGSHPRKPVLTARKDSFPLSVFLF
jgi:hypothetical protein